MALNLALHPSRKLQEVTFAVQGMWVTAVGRASVGMMICTLEEYKMGSRLHQSVAILFYCRNYQTGVPILHLIPHVKTAWRIHHLTACKISALHNFHLHYLKRLSFTFRFIPEWFTVFKKRCHYGLFGPCATLPHLVQWSRRISVQSFTKNLQSPSPFHSSHRCFHYHSLKSAA